MTLSTLRANRVLKDAVHAYQRFDDNPVDVEFRHAAILCLTLLRAVGNVVASENSGTAQAQARCYYKERIQDEPIFKHFIKRYRDSIVKQYSAEIGWELSCRGDKRTVYSYPVQSGYYKRQDLRELVRESIKFWEDHLTAMSKL